MNVTETKSEGLTREYRVSIPQVDLTAKFNAKIRELQPKMNLKGFRPGKVPAAHIKKMYGKSIMGDIVNDLVQETSDKALAEKALRPASRPSIQLTSDQEKLINGEADLDYSMALEVMPEFEPADVTTISIERMVAEVPEAESRCSGSRTTTRLTRRKRARRRRVTRLSSTSSARSTARSSTAARPRATRWCWVRAGSFRASRTSWSAHPPARM